MKNPAASDSHTDRLSRLISYSSKKIRCLVGCLGTDNPLPLALSIAIQYIDRLKEKIDDQRSEVATLRERLDDTRRV